MCLKKKVSNLVFLVKLDVGLASNFEFKMADQYCI